MYSFDVFDTLITRKTATPQGIFTIIQNILCTFPEYQNISKHITANFYELRVNSEELARLNNESNGIEEITLEEIYSAMAMTGCLSKEEQQALCELERRSEIDNIIGISENIQKVKQLLALGEEVILISDMYLDKETISTMLVNTDDILGKLPLHLSSDYKKRKTSGNLYRKIKEIKNIEFKQWIHIGDNLYQDVKVPISLGITAEQYKPGKLTAFEEKLIGQYGNNLNLQLIIGAAKNARRDFNLITVAEKIGCCLSGPVLYIYVDWILSEAVNKGIRRLYFIARDGFLLKNIADLIIKHNNLDIHTYYIYGSRRAWRIPSLSKERFQLYTIIQWSNPRKIKTIGKLAELLMIPVEELYPFLPQGCRDVNIHVTNQSLQYIAERLNNNGEFKDYLIQKYADIRELTVEYLRQEIDICDDAFAFVDVSGGGLTQGCLSSLLQGVYDKPIQTFFFKMDRVNLAKSCNNCVFLPSYLKNNLIIEMICRAPHGQTTGYKKSEGRIVPVLESVEEDAIHRHNFSEYQKGIECFTKQMVELQKIMNLSMNTLNILLKYFNHIAVEPDRETLEFFAALPNSETGRDKKLTEYAPRLSKEDIENIFLKRTYEYIEDYYEGTNFEYSLLRCSKEELDYIELCKNDYNTARGKLARLEKNIEEERLLQQYGRAGRFPYELLEENIIIYGAGKFGQGFYKKVKELGKNTIVQWVDKEFGKYNQQGFNSVESPEMIGTKEYDQLIIAVSSKELAKLIEKELLDRGVHQDKIVWMSTDPFEQKYLRW